jgi:hypothetical protein
MAFFHSFQVFFFFFFLTELGIKLTKSVLASRRKLILIMHKNPTKI